MENKENIINELYRNMQLMKIDSNILNEQTFLKNLFRRSTKFLVDKSLKNFINSNSAIKNIISNPNSQKQINFRDAYNNWVSNPKNKDLQSDLILKYLDLDNVSILSKTEILEKGLNIGYNKLSNIIGQLLENPSNMSNIIKSYNITDTKTITILGEYLQIYRNYGSGKRQKLNVDSIKKLKELAEDSTWWETYSLYKQTFFSLIDGWTSGKEGLEIKMLDKYRAYLDNIKGVTDATQIENITLAYKKSIDNTFRSYLMIQDDLATAHIDTLTKTLKQQSNDPNAIEFSKIIEELKAGTLGEKYPGFKLTYYLASVKDGTKIKQIWNSLNPGYNNLQNIKDLQSKKIPKWIMDSLNSKFGKTMQRTIVWGAFPNKKLLYTLIASNRKGLQKKQWLTLYSLYLQYSFLGALRSALLTIFIPAAYTVSSLANTTLRGFLEEYKINLPFLPELTDEERKQLESAGFLGDIKNVFIKQFMSHYYNTWASVGQIGDGGWDSKIYQIAYGIGIPNEVKAFDNSLIANIITKAASIDFGGSPNKDYDSFYRMIFGFVIPGLDKTKKDIENRAKTEGERIQAGGTQIDVNKPTWKVVQSQRANTSLIDINFPYNKTKVIKINNQYDLDNTHFKNVNNIVRISTPKNFTINTIQITDNNGKTHNINKQ